MLYGKSKPSVPTGFRAFDERNGGILLGSLWTIGANTGGGKTAMAVNVLRNMTEFAAEDCCIVPLEMTATQTMDRLMGILTGLEVNKISQKKLSSGEKKVVKDTYRQYVATLKQNNTRYTIYEPEEDVSIEEVLLTLKPHGYKVILIDYISLLKGADGDDQWRQLGNIARFAKVFAKNNNCIVVLLCQVSEEGKIRYAQAIAEHSNNAWIWTMPGEESETSIMDIRQIKARNQHRFNFQLLSNNLTMRITDLDEGDTDMNNPDEEDDGKPDEKKTHFRVNRNGKDRDKDEDHVCPFRPPLRGSPCRR
jgi:replicative DNA helicase